MKLFNGLSVYYLNYNAIHYDHKKEIEKVLQNVCGCSKQKAAIFKTVS